MNTQAKCNRCGGEIPPVCCECMRIDYVNIRAALIEYQNANDSDAYLLALGEYALGTNETKPEKKNYV